jgi:hypothetical protein
VDAHSWKCLLLPGTPIIRLRSRVMHFHEELFPLK